MRVNPDPRGPVWLWDKGKPAGKKPKRPKKQKPPRPKPAGREAKAKKEASR